MRYLYYLLRIIVEKITGRTCDKCRFNIGGISCNNMTRYEYCVKHIYPREFEPKVKEGAE